MVVLVVVGVISGWGEISLISLACASRGGEAWLVYLRVIVVVGLLWGKLWSL